jgi:hypothetical protein
VGVGRRTRGPRKTCRHFRHVFLAEGGLSGVNEERRCLDFCCGDDVVAVDDEITILGFSL